MTAAYEPEVKAGEQPALNGHEDLFDIIRALRMEPDMTRTQLSGKLFGKFPGRAPPEL
jgi:hypothetical protein